MACIFTMSGNKFLPNKTFIVNAKTLNLII